MDVSGQRFINAPLAKVWTALQDAQTLDACLAQEGAVRRVSPTELEVGRPVGGRVTVEALSPNTLTYRASGGSLRVTLVEERPAMTRLAYTFEAASLDAARAQTEMDQLLDAFAAQVSGPQEIAAGGVSGLQEASLQS